MRVLFTALPATGHVNSMLPLAVATASAGHEILFCTGPGYASTVESFGLRHLSAGAASMTELMAGGPNSDHATRVAADEPCDVVAAAGPDQDPARFGTTPANVRIERFVPQIAVLEHTDLFVTHGGFNSTKEALRLGVPLVVLPISGDQPYTGQRVAALALGRSIGPGERSAERIRIDVREVLANPRYRENARRFAEEMQALPPISHAVALLERLVRERRPIYR